MKVTVAVIGKARDPALAAAARDYETRAARYWQMEVRELREVRNAGAQGAQGAVTLEGVRLLASVPPGSHIVACDPGGKEMTSEAFATWMQQMREAATDVTFVIGGAHGLSADVRTAARTRLSLAPWTLPHELARVVLAEQLYRAGTIIRREPYHK